MKVLLTGATGFVGGNLLLRHLAQGHRVLAPVRNRDKLSARLAGVDVSRLTVLSTDPREWPSLRDIDAAIHCAGALFERTLAPYIKANVAWTASVLAAIPKGCPTVVLSSQSAGGPTPPEVPTRDERDADDPISFYGESKLRMERMICRHSFEAAILRPPMVLGARDPATRQLLDLARSRIRPKPGWMPKSFSFIACDDLLDAIDVALGAFPKLLRRPCYVAASHAVTDLELVSTAAMCLGRSGLTLRLPHAAIHGIAGVVDALPPLRGKLPSLSRDRVREIFADRWVIDSSAFQMLTGWKAKLSLADALRSAIAHLPNGQATASVL